MIIVVIMLKSALAEGLDADFVKIDNVLALVCQKGRSIDVCCRVRPMLSVSATHRD